MISYKNRIDFIDKKLDLISNDNNTKFKILCLIHYILVLIMYAIVFFTYNFYLFLFAIVFFLFQFILNFLDNGCFLLKLERKYKGKGWIGPYVIFQKIYPDLTIQHTMIFYRVFSFLFTLFVLYRFYGFYTNLKHD